MSETPETPPQRSRPGQILKRAREAKNLSVAAIATQMNLDLRIVEALEAGDDARLPAPIFVRGYLRGYARLVEVPESAVLEAYQAQAPQEPVPRAVGMASAPLRPALRRSALPWRGVLLTALLIGAGALGLLVGPQLLQQLGEALQVADGPAPDTTLETAPQTAPGAGLALPAPPASEPTQTPPAAPAPDGGALALPLPPPAPSEEREAPATQAVPSAEPALPAEEDFAASGAAAPAETLPETPPAAPAATAPADAAPQTAAPAASPQPPAAEAPASAAAASAGPRLAFRFTGQNWVEVRDADGNKLLFGLYGGGETREVSGKPPISVLLGNAAGVELRVNGAPFDVVARSSDNIARFRIEAGN